MPKSRHGKAKKARFNKRRNIPQQHAPASTETPAAATNMTDMSLTKPAAPTTPVAAIKPSATIKTSKGAAAAVSFDTAYVVSELKRIGILTGTIVVIIIVLYFIFR